MIPRRKFRAILQNQLQKMSKMESSLIKVQGYTLDPELQCEESPTKEVILWIHQNFQRFFCQVIVMRNGKTFFPFLMTMVRSNKNFVFGRIADCTLQGRNFINPNKAGLFEGSFFWGCGQFDSLLHHTSRRTYLRSLCNC